MKFLLNAHDPVVWARRHPRDCWQHHQKDSKYLIVYTDLCCCPLGRGTFLEGDSLIFTCMPFKNCFFRLRKRKRRVSVKILPTFFLFLGCNNNSPPKLRKIGFSPSIFQDKSISGFLRCPVYNKHAEMSMHAIKYKLFLLCLRRQSLKVTKLRPEIIQQSHLCSHIKVSSISYKFSTEVRVTCWLPP